MSSGFTWTGSTAAVLALTGIATGWYWLLAVSAVLIGVIGVLLIRRSRQAARTDESADFLTIDRDVEDGTDLYTDVHDDDKKQP